MAVSPTSWGNTLHTTSTIHPMSWHGAALPRSAESMLPYGLGRSYGDSCLNDQGTLLSTRSMDRLLHFDTETGIVECEAGVSLEALLKVITPRGWFLPVTPGTRTITLGGAIANDVHGKNHHQTGSFATCVVSFELLRSDGTRRLCSRQSHATWFRATVGGLGLTGLITRVTLQLKKICSPLIEVEQIRMGSLEEFFSLSEESSASHDYTVAWIDGLATGDHLGRGIFFRGNHCDQPADLTWKAPKQIPVPFNAPNKLLNRYTVRAFNSLYQQKVQGSSSSGQVHFLKFFYPLDSVRHWNRLYGKAGFFQYQCVVPFQNKADVLRDLLDRIGRSGQASFLSVLKVFGDHPPEGLLSFPRPGVTLALDLPNRGQATLDLMQELDQIVLAANGALYPAKDARMSPDMFAHSFPALDVFTPFVDPAFSSSFWRRVQETS